MNNGDLISREALLKKYCKEPANGDCKNCDWFGDSWCRCEIFGVQIAEAPAVDAVEVVRCKDCKYQGDNTSCPMLNAVAYTKDDDFCCAGRRGRKIKDICCGGCGAENGGKYENIPQNMLLKVRFPKDGE